MEPPHTDLQRTPLRLDDAQRAVLEAAAEGHAVVLGAPGSGKTTLAIELVAQALERDGLGTAIAIAGSRDAATRLRDRLAARVHRLTLGPLARTMSSFAFALVAAGAAERGATLRLRTGQEQDRLLESLLRGHALDGTGPDWPEPLGSALRERVGFRTEVRECIARATELGLDPETLAALGQRTQRPAWNAVAEVWRELADVAGFETPDGVLALDPAALLDGARAEVRRRGAGTLQTIVVDDAHELTEGGARLIAALADAGVTVIALGDPDLSTGVFRGARAELLASLSARLGIDRAPFVLDHVHRHGAEIRDSVRRATERLGAAGAGLQRRAVSVVGEPREDSQPVSGDVTGARVVDATRAVTLRSTRSIAESAAAIAQTLRERHVLAGVAWSDMAVLVRTHGQARLLEHALAAREVPTGRTGSVARRESLAAELMTALRLALGEQVDDDDALALVHGRLGGVDSVGVRRVRRQLAYRARTDAVPGELPESGLTRLVRGLTEPALLAGLEGLAARRVRSLADSIDAARRQLEGVPAPTTEEVLWGLWERSGIAEPLREAARGDNADAAAVNDELDAVLALFTEAQRASEREPDLGVLQFSDRWHAAQIDADTLTARRPTGTVVISTPAGVIGREFDTVVISGLQDGVWPNLTPRGSLLGAPDLAAAAAGIDPGTVDPRTDARHDELRLLVTAASRAVARLDVVTVDNEDERASEFAAVFGTSERVRPRTDLTLRGVVGRLRRLVRGDDDGESEVTPDEAARALARLATAGVPGADPARWAGLAAVSTTAGLDAVLAPDAPFPVAPSAVDTWTRCELAWTIDRLTGVGGALAAGIGTLVHAAVETLAHEGEEPTAAALERAVLARWHELGVRGWLDLAERRTMAFIVTKLASYFDRIAREGWTIEPVDHEVRFSLALPGAQMRGSIDWIERQGDDVRIVDLKTGKSAVTIDEATTGAQLQSYQLAVASGAVAGVPPTASASAQLVYPRVGANVTIRNRPPMTDDERAAFTALIADAAVRMRGAHVTANLTTHCMAWGPSATPCLIHTIRQVSE